MAAHNFLIDLSKDCENPAELTPTIKPRLAYSNLDCAYLYSTGVGMRIAQGPISLYQKIRRGIGLCLESGGQKVYNIRANEKVSIKISG